MEALALQQGFFAALAFFALGAIGSLVFGGKDDRVSSGFAHICAVLGSCAGFLFSVAALFSGVVWDVTLPFSFGFSGALLHMRIDLLAALFVCIVSTVALAASIYGLGYQKQFFGKYRLRHFGFFYNVFLASMLLVIAAGNALLFLLAWELMAVASFFLVVFERREAENVRAGTLYFLISQLGTLFLFGAFLILRSYTGSWDLDTIRTFAPIMGFWPQTIVLGLALVGFATKAGVIPLHIWLPEAHPAAPSHVSALMSGVMIKTAVFMLIRFFIDLFPAAPEFWGLIILILGAISSLLGVLYALSEHDIKRLLAFHSVENIGIILMGLGAAITFFAHDLAIFGFVSLTAALYHTFNHALFKALLFLSAGSVVHATHTRNMEEYGGIIRLMPTTAIFFLIGAAAISGLPPLNGFVSEWFTFQGLFAGIASLPLVPKLVFILGVSSLAFTGGLAAACFVKAFGAIFLARPRSSHAIQARESEPIMHIGMAFLSVFIVLFGICASSVTPVFAGIAHDLRGIPLPLEISNPLFSVNVLSFSSLSMMWIALALVGGVLLTTVATWIISRKRRVVISRTWDCGAPLTPRMEITATGFSRSIITIFRGLLRPSKQTDAQYHDATMRYFTKSKTVQLSLADVYRTYLYGPAASLLLRSARGARRIQVGNLNVYMLYMFLTVVIVLWWALK